MKYEYIFAKNKGTYPTKKWQCSVPFQEERRLGAAPGCETQVWWAKRLSLPLCSLDGTEGTQVTITLMASSRKLCCHLEDQLYLVSPFLTFQTPSFLTAWISLLQWCVPRPVKCTNCSSAQQTTVLWESFIFHTTLLPWRPFFSSLAEGKGLQKGGTSLFFHFHSCLRTASQNTCIFWQEMPEKQLGSPAPLSAPTHGGTLAWAVTSCVWPLF